MKLIILILMAVAATSEALTVDGSGFFPVVVQVYDVDTRTPIKGASVRMEGAGTYKQLIPEHRIKVLPDSLGKPVQTNEVGVVVVFYYGGWASTTTAEKSVYSRSLNGTVVIEYKGKEIFRSTLKEWAEKNNYKTDTSSVPHIFVELPKAK